MEEDIEWMPPGPREINFAATRPVSHAICLYYSMSERGPTASSPVISLARLPEQCINGAVVGYEKILEDTALTMSFIA